MAKKGKIGTVERWRGGIYHLVYSTTRQVGWYWGNHKVEYGPYNTEAECADRVYTKKDKTKKYLLSGRNEKYWNNVAKWVKYNKRITLENAVRRSLASSGVCVRDIPSMRSIARSFPKNVWEQHLPKSVEYNEDTDEFILSKKFIVPPLRELYAECPQLNNEE